MKWILVAAIICGLAACKPELSSVSKNDAASTIDLGPPQGEPIKAVKKFVAAVGRAVIGK